MAARPPAGNRVESGITPHFLPGGIAPGAHILRIAALAGSPVQHGLKLTECIAGRLFRLPWGKEMPAEFLHVLLCRLRGTQKSASARLTGEYGKILRYHGKVGHLSCGILQLGNLGLPCTAGCEHDSGQSQAQHGPSRTKARRIFSPVLRAGRFRHLHSPFLSARRPETPTSGSISACTAPSLPASLWASQV